MKIRLNRNRSGWLPLLGGEGGASLPEVMIAAAIIAGGAMVANQVAASAKKSASHLRTKAQYIQTEAALRTAALQAMQNRRDAGQFCLEGSAGPLAEAFTGLSNMELGERWLKFEALSTSSPYVPMSGVSLSNEWSTALAACLSWAATPRSGCIQFKIGGDPALSNEKIESKGFISLAAVPWNARENTAVDSCDANMGAQSGMGLRVTQAVFSESRVADGPPARKADLFQPVELNFGEEMTPQPPGTPPTGTQTDAVLHGWRSYFDLPPKPGPGYAAWPVPYKRIHHAGQWWAVELGCATSNCPVAQSLSDCGGNFFTGSKCDRHPWFK